MTDEEFFSATPELRTIYQWARARYAAPWAVFGAVLLRVAASTGPEVQLPGVIGGRASLNMMAIFVAASGGGKGISDATARLAWPVEIHEEGMGSGQGISDLFKQPKKPDAERITRAIFMVPEIDHLAALDAGQGNNTRATLKAGIMGERLGSKGASEPTSRIVPPHTYRLCISVAGQFGHCGVLLDDATGGTPQRGLWFPSTDPKMPAERAADPDPLNTSLPSWARMSNDVVEIQYGPTEIPEQIIAAHLARQRGEGDALDGHWMLTRCKVAAVLAILHHRMVVSELDWALSEVVMAISDRTRTQVIEHAKQADRAKVRDRAMSRAAGEQFISDHKLERAKKAILRWLERDGQLARHDLRRKLKADLRDHFDPAVAELADTGQIVATRDGSQERYSLGSEGTRVPEVHPPNPQLSDRVLEVHGVPEATVTDLGSRRSDDSDSPRVPCRKWLDQHLEQLRAAGETTVTSFAIAEAGQATGYRESAIRQAISGHPSITAIDRKHKETTYSIVGEGSDYKPATEWVHDYLDALPANTETVDVDAFKSAVNTTSYTWPAARMALLRCGRIESVPAHGNSRNERIWRIIPSAEGESA